MDAAARAGGLACDGVGVTFPDGTEALRGVSFSVAPGELVAVVGASGCGKSTLLRAIAGLTAPTAGTVAADRCALGYVFQDPTLLPWRTVRANVELFAELHGIAAPERRRLAADAIALVGLTGSEQQRPAALSGGMRMRVSLARSLTLAPATFLFDEPFGALDEITRERLNDELLRLYATAGFAGVFVTHSVYEACYLAARVLVLSPRPGTVVAAVEVPFAYPRASDLRFEPEFAAVTGEVSRALRQTAAA